MVDLGSVSYIFAEISGRGIFSIVLGSIILLQIIQRLQFEYGPKVAQQKHLENIKKNYESTIPQNRADQICNKCQRQLQTYLPPAENKFLLFHRLGQGTEHWVRPLFCSYCGANVPKKSNQNQKSFDDNDWRKDFFGGGKQESDYGFYRTTKGTDGIYARLFNWFSRSSTGQSMRLPLAFPDTYQQAIQAYGITAEKVCKGREGSGCGYMLVNEEDRFRNTCPKCATKWDEEYEFIYTSKCCHHCRISLEPSARFCFECGEKYKGYSSLST
jgi:hypothetical protein